MFAISDSCLAWRRVRGLRGVPVGDAGTVPVMYSTGSSAADAEVAVEGCGTSVVEPLGCPEVTVIFTSLVDDAMRWSS